MLPVDQSDSPGTDSGQLDHPEQGTATYCSFRTSMFEVELRGKNGPQ